MAGNIRAVTGEGAAIMSPELPVRQFTLREKRLLVVIGSDARGYCGPAPVGLTLLLHFKVVNHASPGEFCQQGPQFPSHFLKWRLGPSTDRDARSIDH
jgi:hypothetical protein